DLLEDDSGRVRGVRFRTSAGERTVSALLTVGADGRDSRTRAAARLPLIGTSPPMDVLWFRLSRRATDRDTALLHVAAGHLAVAFPRTDYWQLASGSPSARGESLSTRSDGCNAAENFRCGLSREFRRSSRIACSSLL